jgi:hypothetical protein
MTTYEVRPTEPDADIVAYQFATCNDCTWRVTTEKLVTAEQFATLHRNLTGHQTKPR